MYDSMFYNICKNKNLDNFYNIIKDQRDQNILDNDQYEQIVLGLEHGLDVEQVAHYSGAYFNQCQMEQIRLGFEHGLSHEQVEVYSTWYEDVDETDWITMKELRLALEDGVPIDVLMEVHYDSVQYIHDVWTEWKEKEYETVQI